MFLGNVMVIVIFVRNLAKHIATLYFFPMFAESLDPRCVMNIIWIP